MKIPRLREWRERRGLRQADLADLVGVDRRTVSLWETGRGGIRPTTARIVANELGVTIDDLLAPTPGTVLGGPKAESWSGPGSVDALVLDPKTAPLVEDEDVFEARVAGVSNPEGAEEALDALARAAKRVEAMRKSAFEQAFSGWLSREDQQAAREDVKKLDRLYERFGPRLGKLWRRREEFIAREMEALDPAEALERLEAAKRDRT
ncbi:MAG: helix-turn-helix domain-containing protein [Actinomycetota bacterium]|nr:helix-turn-helix domain-containing protein [Actinomycetota bacterium]